MSRELEQKYIEYYKQMNSKDYYIGMSLKPVAYKIAKLVEQTKAETLLDYGCGLGRQYTSDAEHIVWGGIMPDLYDPGVEKYSDLPDKKYDGVFSTDVFEHIPEPALQYAFENVYSRAKKFVFLQIATFEAIALLPNGENAHVTVKHPEWWRDKAMEYHKKGLITVLSFGCSESLDITLK